MLVELQRLSNDRHRLTLRWPDGRVERAELETRSFLLHDLVHYAVEAQIPLQDGFYGTLAAGASLALLAAEVGPEAAQGLQLAERLTGPMQSCWRGRYAVDDYAIIVEEALPHLDGLDFTARVMERLRRLEGRWKATPFGQTMVLSWPPEP